MTLQKIKSSRILYFDILRTIACLSVIMLHSSAWYHYKDFGSFNYCVGNILNSLSRIGVPLFVMISGALMLDKNYEYSAKKIAKHIIRMIAFFIFWSAVCCVIFQILIPLFIHHEPVDIKMAIINFVKGYYHLWFVFMIVGLYLIVPLLRLWVKDENKKYVEYFIILSIIFTYILPEIIYIGSNYNGFFVHLNYIVDNLFLKYAGAYTAYFILGWYIHNYDIKNKIIYILGGLGLIITVVGTYILQVSTGEEKSLYGNLTLNVLLQAAAVFTFIKAKFINIQDKNYRFVNSVSKYSLGIYALQSPIIDIIYSVLNRIGFDNAIINIPTVFIVTFAVSYLCSFILSKIPFLKRIV